MKINVHDIEAEAKELVYDEPTDELAAHVEHGSFRDFDFPTPAHVVLRYYRGGQELFFNGSVSGPVIGHCGRCLEDFLLDFQRDFAFVLVPADTSEAEGDAEEEGVDIGVYRGELVDVSPTIREQIVLALPTRALCSESCSGLCQQCGANLNHGSCACPAPAGDPRLAVLRDLKASH